MAKRRNLDTRTPSDPLHAAMAMDISRSREALRVYRPGNDKQERIHTSEGSTLIVGGANRGGKTVCTMAEFVSRVSGERITGLNGNSIPPRFPVPNGKRKHVYWIVGYNLDHIGQTFYRVLFEPGLFDIIYDTTQGAWVTFNENIPWHAENADKKQPAEPLIPPRMIKEDSWTWNAYGGGAAKNCFSSVELNVGAVIYAFPSTTPQPKQGDPIDGLLIDEDTAFAGHVSEYVARLADRGGWFMWPAWPHDENYTLSNMIEGCQKAMEEGDTRFEYVHLTLRDNPFVADTKKQLQVARFNMIGDDDLVASRIDGIQGHEGRRMYDFSGMVHGVSSETSLQVVPELDPRTRRGVIQRQWRLHHRFPEEWTRYFSIDPSTQRTAIIFGVVPPPEVEGVEMPPTLVIEREVVLKRATPTQVAKAIKEVTQNMPYEAFIIDRNFGRQKHFAAGGIATWDILANAFRDEGLISRLSKEWFIPGCNVPEDRQASVRTLLEGDFFGGPAVYFVLDYLPETLKEFARYYKKKTEYKGVEVVEDTAENPRKFDCMAALEYLADYVLTMMKCGQHWVHPRVYRGDDAMSSLAAEIMGSSQPKGYIHLGPGTAA